MLHLHTKQNGMGDNFNVVAALKLNESPVSVELPVIVCMKCFLYTID